MTVHIDFLGEKICAGDRAVMCQGYSHSKFFKLVTVLDLREDRAGNTVKIIADGNSVAGWTRPKRLIVQKNFEVQI